MILKHCALLSRTFLRCCPYVSSVTCRYLGEYVSVLHRRGHCHWRERASSDFDGTQLFTQLDSRSWSETSRGLWLGQPDVDSAGATIGFDGSRRVTRRSPKLDSRSSGEKSLTLVSPSYFER